jgi:hypothetical protein
MLKENFEDQKCELFSLLQGELGKIMTIDKNSMQIEYTYKILKSLLHKMAYFFPVLCNVLV